MLDIRATTYISPVAEMDFASVPLTVRLSNVADETGLATGRFRVYNTTTGTLIHTSEILPVSLQAGQSVDASAFTDFDPPTPLDNTYFVVFDGHATNALVPNGIGIFLGAFHFDVKPVGMGPAPAAHHTTHELGGSDEVNVTGLTGAALKGAFSEASNPTPTPNANLYMQVALTALAEAADFQNPTGTFTDGQTLKIRILDDSTPRALTWGAAYVSRGPALPAITVADKLMYVGLIYNNAQGTWDCVAATVEA